MYGYHVLPQAVTSALALGWSCYASSLSNADPDALVSLALKAVAMLEQCSKVAAEAAAKGTGPDTHGNIGACLSGKQAVSCSWPGIGISPWKLCIAPKAVLCIAPKAVLVHTSTIQPHHIHEAHYTQYGVRRRCI